MRAFFFSLQFFCSFSVSLFFSFFSLSSVRASFLFDEWIVFFVVNLQWTKWSVKLTQRTTSHSPRNHTAAVPGWFVSRSWALFSFISVRFVLPFLSSFHYKRTEKKGKEAKNPSQRESITCCCVFICFICCVYFVLHSFTLHSITNKRNKRTNKRHNTRNTTNLPHNPHANRSLKTLGFSCKSSLFLCLSFN